MVVVVDRVDVVDVFEVDALLVFTGVIDTVDDVVVEGRKSFIVIDEVDAVVTGTTVELD